MTRDSEAYATLIDELDMALEHVNGQYEKFVSMRRRAAETGDEDDMSVAALGYTVHNLYNAIENYFLRIAKFFENNLDHVSWHRDLINRMAMNIERVRPALLERESVGPFHELRAFRHVFRVIYDSTLDPRKLAIAVEEVEPAVTILRSAHDRYCTLMRAIRDGLSSCESQ